MCKMKDRQPEEAREKMPRWDLEDLSDCLSIVKCWGIYRSSALRQPFSALLVPFTWIFQLGRVLSPLEVALDFVVELPRLSHQAQPIAFDCL